MTINIEMDVASLTAALVDVPSVSGDEAAIADAVDSSLRALEYLDVEREGNVILARTDTGAAQRIVLAGHLDTVPIAANVPSRQDGTILYGCGTTDMKSGVAVMLRMAALLRATPTQYDLTYVFYDCEEIEAARNGLGRIARTRPEVLRGDLAIVLEPTNGAVEAGCQGTMRAEITLTGTRAHTARSWLGRNAIHAAAPVLHRLTEYEPRSVDIDGCVYREGLSAVGITGGVAGNVIPDACTVTMNFRFAPDRSIEHAEQHVRTVFPGYDVVVTDVAPAAMPRLGEPAAAAFVAAIGLPPAAKFGWTDVARFAELGIPAVNFGPGDPDVAHTRGESVDLAVVERVEQSLLGYLTA
ncbi:MAG TPA: succinyl-diaminopimelate desuccinylase [Acidothermaceae bacterium]|nr:succinyl-diaminopimelate desuccinylase [Acidothermaceae bacterium]